MPGTEIYSLMGQPLKSVWFVMDYVELHFEAGVLRILQPPTISIEGRSYEFPHPGSRDALCSLIALRVVDVEFESSDGFVIKMEGTAVLRVPLTVERVVPEVLNFIPKDKSCFETW